MSLGHENATSIITEATGDKLLPSEVPEYQAPVGIKDGLAEHWNSHPASVHAESLGRRVWNTLRTIPEDVKASDHKLRTIGAFVIGASSQVADKLRWGFTYFAAQPAVETFKDTHNVNKTALVAALGFLAWNTFVGESFNYGLSEYKKTKREVVKDFPLMIEVLDEVLPGIDQEPKEAKKEGLVKKTAQKIKSVPASVWLTVR